MSIIVADDVKRHDRQKSRSAAVVGVAVLAFTVGFLLGQAQTFRAMLPMLPTQMTIEKEQQKRCRNDQRVTRCSVGL